MPRLTKQYRFCAAHKYWNDEWTEEKNIEIFRDDVKLHGHNYQLDITVSGPIDKNSGFIINIQDLNSVVNARVIKFIDHSQIEKDIPWFENKQPSTENMVLFIWGQLTEKIPPPAALYSIKLRETSTMYTEYFGPEKKND